MYKLCFYVPIADAEKVKEAVFATGAGKIGDYEACCWQCEGQGQFRPVEGANPTLGEKFELNHVTEAKIEMVCDDAVVQPAIEALIKAHPFEEPAYQCWPVFDIKTLDS